MYDSDVSFKIYFSDFPTCLILSRLREYPAHFETFEQFLSQAAEGTLPTFSWVEPRWFDFLLWPENDEHPHAITDIGLSGNIMYGEFFLKEIYEALRSSPAWNDTALIITYDEHGGLYDHVSPPQKNIPNPDGMDSTDPAFSFDRLGIRVPTIVVSPWVKKGSVYHEPAVNHYDHTSILGTLRKMLSLKQPPLTKREAWSASFEHIFQNVTSPRTDCLETLPLPPSTEKMWEDYIAIQRTPETPSNVEKMIEENPDLLTRSPGITELQEEILRIADRVAKTGMKAEDTENLYEAGLFIRKQIRAFLDFS